MNTMLSRQVADILPSKKGLEALMKKKKIRLYLGIDPTSPQLHLGHAVALRKLRQFQDAGHEVILLFGTFTARIGDPSGQDKARQPLSESKINENIRTYRKQASLILDMKRLRIEKNHTWLDKMSLSDTEELASHITVARLLERDMFQERKKRGQAVWMHELLYPLLQGYDSVALDVDLEVGGTDQTFNMLVGRELQRAYHNKEKYILTTPLLLGPDGKKMSKSLGNTINLLDKPNEMYGKVMSVNDEFIGHYFELCIDIKPKKGNKRDQKAQLAYEIVRIYHGDTKANKAEKEFDRVFREKGLPTKILKAKVRARRLSLVELLEDTRMVSSRSEARRLISQGGVKIDGEVQRENKIVVAQSGTVIQVGPKRFMEVL